MLKWYLKAVGKLVAGTAGKWDRYSPQQLAFLSSGYLCPCCGSLLMRWWGAADVKCYAASGEEVPLLSARKKGSSFECPKCRGRWRIREEQE